MFERVIRELELGLMLLADFPNLRGSGSETAKETRTFLWPFQASVKIDVLFCELQIPKPFLYKWDPLLAAGLHVACFLFR